MWIHFPEMSVNLAQVSRIVPKDDGSITLFLPETEVKSITLSGGKAHSLRNWLRSQNPSGGLWFSKRWAGDGDNSIEPGMEITSD